MKKFIMAVAASVLAVTAQSQTLNKEVFSFDCGNASQIMGFINQRFGETVTTQFDNSNETNRALVLMENKQTKTWTILLVDKSVNRACVYGDGDGIKYFNKR
jgi:hypothetical protein